MSSGSVTILGDGGVELNGNIVTRGPDNGFNSFSSGGPVDISARAGSIRLAGIDTRGGSGISPTGGGSITITGSGAFRSTTIVTGALLAGGGTQDATGFQVPGGAIGIRTSSFPQPTELLGEVRTNQASIEIGGEGLEAHSAIATSGLGKVTVRGFDSAVTLDQAVTGGRGGIEIRGNGIDFFGPLATTGGDLLIASTGAAGSVTGQSGGTITTGSGSVTIVANTGVSLTANVVTAGGTNGAGQGSPGGQVRVSTQSGGIRLSSAGIDSRGGASTAPGSAGAIGGSILMFAGGGELRVNGDLLASGGAEVGASGRALGGAIVVNSAVGQTRVDGDVETTGSIVDLRGGAYLIAGGAITTSGGVILRGGFIVTLWQGVSAGRGGIDIAITNSGGQVALGGALVTSGGDVTVHGGNQVSVTDDLSQVFPFLWDPIGTSITTSAAPNSGQPSGRVTIATADVALLSSSIDTSGANTAAGAGRPQGRWALSPLTARSVWKGSMPVAEPLRRLLSARGTAAP